MRNHLLSSVAAIAIIAVAQGSVLAADPYPAADPYQPALTAPTNDWSGFYVGGHLGWGSARFTGTLDVGDADIPVSTSASGIVGGMHIGQNWTHNTFVVGWEADASATGWGKHTPASGATDPYAHMDVNVLASLRGRIGMPMDRSLIYATGGLAFVNGKLTAGFGTTDYGQASLNKLGGVLGLGVEMMTSQNFSLRAEGLWYLFGGTTNVPNHDGSRTTTLKLKDALVFRIGATHHFN